MGSQTKAKVPIIDFSNEKLKPGNEEWILACKDVRNALEEFGCFLVNYDKVSFELHNSIFEATQELFDLPHEIKAQKTSEKPYHSYFGRYTSIPLYESMAVDDPTSLKATRKFTEIMWPGGNNRFCETAHSFSSLVAKVNEVATKMVFDSYGASKLCDSHVESTTYLLRGFKYRVPEKDETNDGLLPHTDLTFISIIHQHVIGGLQIETLDGEWIDIEPAGHSSFIVMAGDILTAWSNDRIRACKHRVTMRGDIPRYSLGLFSFKNGSIQVPEELVDDTTNPLKFKPFDVFEFLHFAQANASRTTVSRIKDYCGVSS